MAIDSEVFDRAFDAAESKLAEVEATPTEPASEKPTEDIVETAQIKEAVEETQEKASKSRDDTGRFTKAQKKEAAKEQISTDQVAEEQVAQEPTVEESTETAIEPPTFWSTEDKEVFAKAPKEVQQAFSRYEAQRNEYVNRLANEAGRGKHYEKRANEVFEPYKLKLQAQGIKDEFEAVDRLLAWNELFEKDPKTAISDLMRKNGLSPQNFVEDVQNQSPQEAAYQDPRVNEALERAERAERTFEEWKQQQEMQSLQTQIDSFKSGVDSTGQPRKQFAEMYAPQISNALEQIQKVNPGIPLNDALNHAYEYVVAEARKAFGVNGNKLQMVKKPETVVAQAKKAQAAASSVTGAPSSGTSVSRPRAKTIDEAIDRAFERVSA